MSMSRIEMIEADSQSAENEAGEGQVEEVVPTAQPTKESVERRRRLAELNQLRVTTETVLPPVKAAISIDGIPIFEMADVGACKGKQKAGKSTMLKALAATWMKGELFRLKSELEGAKVLWLDTEQKALDVKQIVDDVMRLSGMDSQYIDSHLKVYTVRTLTCKTLLDDTQLLVSTYQPNIVIVDGLVDLLESFNDEAQSHVLINSLIKMCADYNCVIISVLHENKGADDRNMRGHLGTMLAQKAGTVLACKKDANGVITVSCADSRHQAMPDWRIRYDEYGNIVSADDNVQTPAQIEKERRLNIIKTAIHSHGGEVTRKVLTEEMISALHLTRSTVANLLSGLIKNNTLSEVDGKVSVQSELDWFG